MLRVFLDRYGKWVIPCFLCVFLFLMAVSFQNEEGFFFGLLKQTAVTLDSYLEYFGQQEERKTINEFSGILINSLIQEEEEEFIANIYTVGQLNNHLDYLKYLYAVDETAYVKDGDFDVPAFLDMDFTTDFTGSEPKILIFHTHSQETFMDSRPGMAEDSIVGVGAELARILAEKYGVSVVHDRGQYDVVDGKEVRGGSYEAMEPAVRRILEKYPSIEVILDLHRDGVPDDVHLVTEIEGKPVAKIMFFNGITRENKAGKPRELPHLENPYIRENLGFSLQMQIMANTLYPGMTRKIYIKPYRYSLHLAPKSLLVEVGANTNTVAEAKNAMEPLAGILVEVLDKNRQIH